MGKLIYKILSSTFLTANILMASNLYASTITMDFTVIDFNAATGSPHLLPPPAESVSGTIAWEADSLRASITSLTSIDVNITGHQFTLAEMETSEFRIDPDPSLYFAIDASVLENGVGSYNSTGWDFFITFNVDTLSPFGFAYNSELTPDEWYFGETFSEFVITAVPEPTILALMFTGIIGLGIVRRKVRKS